MDRLGCLFVAIGVTGCIPWIEATGPTAGAGVVYREDRGLSPQITAGYAHERYNGWYGWAADAQVAVEPWRRTVNATTMLRGSFVFWEFGVGPSVEWSPDGVAWGVSIAAGGRIAIGKGTNCGEQRAPDDDGGCLGPEDTLYRAYLPRVHYQAAFMTEDSHSMAWGADLILSQYWLQHGETRPADLH